MVREKYLPYTEPEKKPDLPQTPEQQRKAKWENFWYYHKAAVLISVFAVAVIVLTIFLLRPDKKPDLTVYLVTSAEWSDSNITELEEMICPFAADSGGDSITKVEVRQFVVDPANEASRQALLTDLESGEVFLFVCDEDNAAWLAKEGVLAKLTDGTALADDAPLTEYADVWTVNDLFKRDYYFSQMEKPYYFCRRIFSALGATSGHEEEQYWSMTTLGLLRSNKPYDENYFSTLQAYQDKCWEKFTGSKPE